MVVAVAVAVRGRPLVELDRFGLMGYDQAAYFVGARALARGYLPYRDFVHVQPPGVLVALAPFALVGSWGFTAAKVLVVALGAASTALVWRLARSWLGALAAILAALAYAVNRSSVGAHRYVLVDPFVTMLLLCAIVLHRRHSAARGPVRSEVAVGVLLALAVGFKLSALVAVVAFAIAWAGFERRRAIARVALGFSAGLVALVGPFALLAPRALIDQVVSTQAGRNRSVSAVDRLLSTFWLAGTPPSAHRALAVACVAAALAVLVGWGATSRSFLGLLGASWLALGTGFVLAAPQFYDHYGELAAPPLALLVGGFVSASVSVRWPRRARVVPWATRGLLTAVVLVGGIDTSFEALPAPFLHVPGEYRANTRIMRAAISSDDCVVTDSPEIVLAVPSLRGYSIADAGPTVDPYAAAVAADTTAPIAPASLERFERSMARCRWFAAPRTWSPRAGYPGWTSAMQARFMAEHELVSSTAGMELWRSVADAPERDAQP